MQYIIIHMYSYNWHICPLIKKQFGTCCLKSLMRFTVVLASALLVDPAFADSELTQTEPRADETFAMAEFDILDGSGVLENVNDEVGGIPMEPLIEGWPEDLIIAPVPGYSPQLGWMLSGLAGYFMDLDKQNSDTKPSIIGAFGMISENDSYVYGVGTYLHLFGDKLRVKAGRDTVISIIATTALAIYSTRSAYRSRSDKKCRYISYRQRTASGISFTWALDFSAGMSRRG